MFCLGLIGGLVLVLIFVIGRNLAQNQLNHSEVNISMHIYGIEDSYMNVNVKGSLENRGQFSAYLYETDVDLAFEDTVYGRLTMPAMRVPGSESTPLDFNTTLRVSNMNAWHAFSTALLREAAVTTQMKASLSVKALGVKYTSLSLDKRIQMKGFNSFSSPPIAVLQQDTVGASETEILMALTAQLTNTADVSIEDFGVLNFTLNYNGVDVGYVVSNGSVGLPCGASVVQQVAHLVRSEASEAAIAELFGLYLSGATVAVTLRGNEHTTQHALFRPAMAAFASASQLIGLAHLEDKVFLTVYSPLDTGNMLASSDPVGCGYTAEHRFSDVYVYAHNPLNVDVLLQGVDLNVTWEGDAHYEGFEQPVYYANGRFEDQNHLIPAGRTVIIPQRLCLTDQGESLVRILLYVAQIGADPNGVVPFLMRVTVDGTVTSGPAAFGALKTSYVQKHIGVVSRILPA